MSKLPRRPASALAIVGGALLLLLAILAVPVVANLGSSDRQTGPEAAALSATNASAADIQDAMRKAMNLPEGARTGEEKFAATAADDTAAASEAGTVKYSLRVEVSPGRQVSLSVAFFPGEAVGGTDEQCASRVKDGLGLSCSVFEAPGKKPGVVTTNDTYPTSDGEWVSRGPLDTLELLKAMGATERWQLRQAKVAWSDDVVVFMSERVKASQDSDAFNEKLFSIAEGDLQAAVTSPELAKVVDLLARRLG